MIATLTKITPPLEAAPMNINPPTIQAGSQVYFRWKVSDETQDPPLSPPNPIPSAVNFTLTDPTSAVQVSGLAMTALTGSAAGEYAYTYQTTNGAAVGLWTMQVTVLVSGTTVFISLAQPAFTLVS